MITPAKAVEKARGNIARPPICAPYESAAAIGGNFESGLQMAGASKDKSSCLFSLSSARCLWHGLASWHSSGPSRRGSASGGPSRKRPQGRRDPAGQALGYSSRWPPPWDVIGEHDSFPESSTRAHKLGFEYQGRGRTGSGVCSGAPGLRTFDAFSSARQDFSRHLDAYAAFGVFSI